MERLRYTHTQRRILELLRTQPQISYNDMAAHLHIDRDTAIVTTRQLEITGRIKKSKGVGQHANSYEVLR